MFGSDFWNGKYDLSRLQFCTKRFLIVHCFKGLLQETKYNGTHLKSHVSKITSCRIWLNLKCQGRDLDKYMEEPAVERKAYDEIKRNIQWNIISSIVWVLVAKSLRAWITRTELPTNRNGRARKRHTCYSTIIRSWTGLLFSISWRNKKVMKFITKWAIGMSCILRIFSLLHWKPSTVSILSLHNTDDKWNNYISRNTSHNLHKLQNLAYFGSRHLRLSIPANCSLDTAAKQSGEAQIYSMNTIINRGRLYRNIGY